MRCDDRRCVIETKREHVEIMKQDSQSALGYSIDLYTSFSVRGLATVSCSNGCAAYADNRLLMNDNIWSFEILKEFSTHVVHDLIQSVSVYLYNSL